MEEKEQRQFGDSIQGIPVAMLTTLDEGNELRSRPMATLQADFDGALWLFTHSKTPKVNEVEHDRRVAVSYSDPDEHRYVSVTGHCRTIRDRSKAEKLWSPLLKAWFPQGLDDPDLALLRVDVDHAE